MLMKKLPRVSSTITSMWPLTLALSSLKLLLAYLQNLGHWALGLWISTGSAALALALFFSGSLRYRYFRRHRNPVARFCLVIVAAWKKSSVEIPVEGDGLYEVWENNRAGQGGRRMLHTKEFMFLDHAAIITFEDTIPSPNQTNANTPPNPWRLCTVTQVEEAKCTFCLIPIWLCIVTFSGLFVQMYSLFAEQGASMRTTTMHNFHIPPASMFIFDIISVSTFIIFYERLIAPLYIKITKTVPKRPSDLRKMGYGLIFVMAGMSTAGFVEIQREKYAGEGSEELSSLFILWQVPQYVLLGVGEAFVYVGQFDFFGHQVPDVMRSLGIALSLSSYSIGSYLCSLLLSAVMKITTKGGRAGWVPPNLNDGFLERYFFLMSALGVLELALYVWCAQCYKAISLVAREVTRRENGAP